MSIIGKDTTILKKKDLKESRNPGDGFTKLVFAHKASAGETGIDLGALVTPTEMSALGFTNPSPSRLLEAKLFQFKDNLKLQSSSKGVLMQSLSYRIASNGRITFEGFTAEDGEIFIGVIDSNPVSGIQVIDAKQPVASGDLPDGDTDFAIGFSTSTTDDNIVVFRNGLEQKRNTNNSSTVTDGNYYVVDNGSGFGNVIRFNTAASAQDDYIKVTAIGGVVESPTNSTWDELEKVQGQVDALVPTVSALAGVPETDFQAAPNNVDLKQFGDRVLQAETDIDDLEVREWNQADFFEEFDQNIVGAYPGFSGGTEVTGIENVRIFGSRVGNTYSLGIFFNLTTTGAGNGFDSFTLNLVDHFSFLAGKTITRATCSMGTNINNPANDTNGLLYATDTGGTSLSFGLAGRVDATSSRVCAGTLVLQVED